MTITKGNCFAFFIFSYGHVMHHLIENLMVVNTANTFYETSDIKRNFQISEVKASDTDIQPYHYRKTLKLAPLNLSHVDICKILMILEFMKVLQFCPFFDTSAHFV